jgi:hypothetical protein
VLNSHGDVAPIGQPCQRIAVRLEFEIFGTPFNRLLGAYVAKYLDRSYDLSRAILNRRNPDRNRESVAALVPQVHFSLVPFSVLYRGGQGATLVTQFAPLIVDMHEDVVEAV